MFDSLIFSKIVWLGLGGTFILGANYWQSHRFLHELKKGKSKENLDLNDPDAYYQRFFNLSLEMLCIADFHGYFRRINPAFTKSLGYSLAELVSKPYLEFVHPDDREKTLQQVEKLTQGEQLTSFENRYRHADGSYHVLAWTAVPYPAEKLIYASARDITERQQMESQLQHNVTHDSLTNLPNRVLFLERLTQVLKQYQNNAGINFAVLFLDLDDFKLVNSSLGNLIGDELLKAIAQRLQSCLSPTSTLARLGGDEFTILLERIATVQEVIQIAENIHQQFNIPFAINNQDIVINTSIGIVFNTTEYNNPEAILKDADIAMYYAKNQGKGHYAIFDRQMRQQAIERLQLESELRRAIAKQELSLYYQPIISLQTGKITGFEALIRWQHPEKGLISPDLFIPIAEKTGLIISLGYWVIQEACGQLQKWQDKYLDYADLKMNINLSYQQLCDQHLLDKILTTLNRFNVQSSCLKIEITESTLIESVDIARAILLALGQYKIELCLDDFGTGYSSLAYLHQFPFNVVKIDRSFIVEQKPNNDHLEIVKAIITLAHNLGMKVVAEGIETQIQFAQLSELSCDDGQGDFFASPLSAPEVEALLQQAPQWD